MFTSTDSSTGQFGIRPIPELFFELPSPFGSGAMLVLNGFGNNSAKLAAEHHRGVQILVAQVRSSWGPGSGVGEFYGITDRSGSDALNQRLSGQRAQNARDALWSALGFGEAHINHFDGLGETFAAEYFQEADDSRHGGFRGVACYVWESFAVARDTVLQMNVKAAKPPDGGGGFRRTFLAPLHLGRRNSACPFA
jgi:hypothetical protein